MVSQAFESKKVYFPSEHVVTRCIADETILVPISGNLANMERIFTLNEMGVSIWRLLDGKKSLEKIWQELLREFDVDEDELSSDMAEFIEQLKVSGLIAEKAVA